LPVVQGFRPEYLSAGIPVDAVADHWIDPCIPLDDQCEQSPRVLIRIVPLDVVKRRVEHADNLRRLVADRDVSLPVPEHRKGYATRVVGVGGSAILLMAGPVRHAVSWVPFGRIVGPALFAHQVAGHRPVDQVFQVLEWPHDQGAVRPGTGKRHVEGVAARLARNPRSQAMSALTAQLLPGNFSRDINTRKHFRRHRPRPTSSANAPGSNFNFRCLFMYFSVSRCLCLLCRIDDAEKTLPLAKRKMSYEN